MQSFLYGLTHLMIVYYNGRYLNKSEVCISPDDRGFLFGDGTYEVVRIYQGRLFHMEEHLNRLARSLQEVQIRMKDLMSLSETGQILIQKNGLGQSDAMLYVQITRGVAPRSHRFPPDISSTLYMEITKRERPLRALGQGVAVILAPDRRWGRCDIKSIALLANVLASQEAAAQDAHETVFIRNNVLTEGTHTNFCAVFKGVVHTHPADCHILDGITRDLVLCLCRENNIPVAEVPVRADRIGEMDEAFILGTTTEIMPVILIDGNPVGSGGPGPVTRKLQTAFENKIKEHIR